MTDTQEPKRPEWIDATTDPPRPARILTPRNFAGTIASVLVHSRIGFKFTPDTTFDLDSNDSAAVARAKVEFDAATQPTDSGDPRGMLFIQGKPPGLNLREQF
jgi:hypothetical protein